MGWCVAYIYQCVGAGVTRDVREGACVWVWVGVSVVNDG